MAKRAKEAAAADAAKWEGVPDSVREKQRKDDAERAGLLKRGSHLLK